MSLLPSTQGAQARDLISKTMSGGVVLAAPGAAAGVTGGLLLTRLIRSMLFGVTTTDPVIFVTVPVLRLAVAALASLLPALRAASRDPLEILRSE